MQNCNVSKHWSLFAASRAAQAFDLGKILKNGVAGSNLTRQKTNFLVRRSALTGSALFITITRRLRLSLSLSRSKKGFFNKNTSSGPAVPMVSVFLHTALASFFQTFHRCESPFWNVCTYSIALDQHFVQNLTTLRSTIPCKRFSQRHLKA